MAENDGTLVENTDSGQGPFFPERCLDRAVALRLAATMARSGLHDLQPWWSPDVDGMVDPLDDPEVKADVRRFLGRMWREVRAMADVR